MKIIKRDGRIKDFDENRIKDAIKAAYNDVYKYTEANHLTERQVININIKVDI